MTLLFLFFLHFLADFPLQGPFLSQEKGKSTLLMTAHVSIWTGLIATGLYIVQGSLSWWELIFLFFVHFIFDVMKARSIGIYKLLDPMKGGLWLDQIVHLVQIITVFYL
jgi:Protein of unknown function (DUF3307)